MDGNVEKFFDPSVKIDRNQMRTRIQTTSNSLGWQETIHYLLRDKKSLEGLKVAEIGCGSGTFSLTFRLLGAETVLMDADQDAIDIAQHVFSLYDQTASFSKENVLDSVPEKLKRQFDIVSSSGLAEHFLGEDRVKCLQFHKELLKPGGFTFIGVPNRWSLPYRSVRLIKELTKTWTIDLEKPYSYWELKKLAEQAGFSDSAVVGNHSLLRDIADHSVSFVATLLDILPKGLREKIRSSRRKTMKLDKASNEVKSSDENFEKILLQQVVERLKQKNGPQKMRMPKDYFGAGLILFGFVDQ